TYDFHRFSTISMRWRDRLRSVRASASSVVPVEGSLDAMAGDGSARYLEREPGTDILFQADAAHDGVDGLLQRLAKRCVVDARGIVEPHVVPRKGCGRKRPQRNAVFLGILAYGRVHRAGEAMEESTLDAIMEEKLAHVLQG